MARGQSVGGVGIEDEWRREKEHAKMKKEKGHESNAREGGRAGRRAGGRAGTDLHAVHARPPFQLDREGLAALVFAPGVQGCVSPQDHDGAFFHSFLFHDGGAHYVETDLDGWHGKRGMRGLEVGTHGPWV